MIGGKRSFNQEKAAETVHAAIDQAASLAQTIIEQSANRAVESAQKARDSAQKAREASASLSAQATDRLDSATKTIEREVAPSVRDVAVQAASIALELWQAARDKAEQAIETGKTGVPDAAGHAMELAERRVEEVGAMAKSASKQAASATADAGKETGSTLLWAGAAAGLVLYGVLQKERRDQVLKFAESALAVTRDLIGEYKGHDASFESPAS